MPEGHTLHRIARDLHATFAGQVVEVSSPQGRFADGAALLTDHELVEARATASTSSSSSTATASCTSTSG